MRARGAATIAKLLDSASAILCAEGAAAVSVQRVADAAGTSKALVHYHFTGKDALLVACANRLASQLVEAEAGALHASTAASALNDLWRVLMHPRVRALRRALLALTTDATGATRGALADAAARRRDAAARVLGRLEEFLGFAPAVPRATLAVAFVALIDGLTLDDVVEPGPHHRSAFDAFWLAVLSLER